MSNNSNYAKRKTYFIQKGFQGKLILKFVLLLVFMAVISSVILYFLAGKELETSYYEAHSSIKSTWDLLFPLVLVTNLVSVLVIAVATVYLILYNSHKIAGPLYKLEKVVNEVTEGNLDLRVNLRKNDQVKALGDAVENMLEKFSGKISTLKAVSHNFSEVEKKLSAFSNGSTATEKDIKEVYSLVKNNNTKLETELNEFKVK